MKKVSVKMASKYFSVHVAGLPHDTTQKELMDLFKEAGDVKDVHVAGKSNGIDPAKHRFTYGFIRYMTKAECECSISRLNNWLLRQEYKLRVTMAHYQPQNSEKSKDERLASDFDPRSMKSLRESLSRLGWEGEMSALVNKLTKVEYKPFDKNWSFPQEDIRVSTSYLDNLRQEIQELEKGRKSQVNSNSYQNNGPYSKNYHTTMSKPASCETEIHDNDPHLKSTVKSPQGRKPSATTENTLCSLSEMTTDFKNLKTGDIFPAGEPASGSNYSLSVSQSTEHKSETVDHIKSSGLLETDRPVCVGRGAFGRGKLPAGYGETKPGQENKTVVLTGRGRAILEKYKQLD